MLNPIELLILSNIYSTVRLTAFETVDVDVEGPLLAVVNGGDVKKIVGGR